MNNLRFISIETILDEWLEEFGLDRERLNINTLIRQASDCHKWFSTPTFLEQKIKLLPVGKLGKVDLPNNFKKLEQIACKIPRDKRDCTTIEKISSWVQHDIHNDVDVEIKVKCNKCPETCTCDTPSVEIDIDRIWEKQNWHLQAYSKFAKPSKFGQNRSVYNDKFELMSYATKPLHAVKYHIPNCFNLHAKDCTYKYAFQSYNLIQTDLPENAEVLITYLAEQTDAEGNLMVPDQPDAIDAIKFHLSSRYFLKKYNMSLETRHQQAYRSFELDRERAIGLARSSMEQLGYNELNAFFKELFSWDDPVSGRGSNPYKKYGTGY